MDPRPILDRLRANDAAGARQLAEAELVRSPHTAELLCLYARACLAMGDAGNANAALDEASRLDPSFPPVWLERAALARSVGNLAKQREALEQALMLASDNLSVALDLARVCIEQRDVDQAEALLDTICNQTPSAQVAWRMRGELRLAQRNFHEAGKFFERALALNANDAAALEGGALVAEALDDLPREIELRRLLVALSPQAARQNTLLAEALLREEQNGEARYCLDAALGSDPNNLYVRWRRMNALPTMVDTPEQSAALRDDWLRELGEMEQRLQGRKIDPRQALSLIDSSTNFYLHYLGEPLLEIQKRYGAFLGQLATQAFPGYDNDGLKRVGRPPRGKRIRVGFVSSHFHQHTVLKLFQGWVTGLDRERFETFVFHLDAINDPWTQRVRNSVDHFAGARDSVAEWPALIRGADLDLLIHLDVGMHPHSQTLAALRLAPVQATAWGHPITTGLSTIDYFLSSAAMEAPDAERNYSESLVRLPRLSISYGAPSADPDESYRVPLPTGISDYVFCPQSAQKLHPEHDVLFADFAAGCPEIPIVLVPHNQPKPRAQLEARMRRSFVTRGLDYDRHILMLPGLHLPQFLAVARGARMLLDSLDWSGGNTALETLWFGVPAITCPSTTLRSRHTAAFLDLLGLPQSIVAQREQYAERAASFARDDDALQAARKTILANRSELFGDREAVPSLERWIERTVSL